MKIGTLKKVELREIWSREDKDFTIWLSDNLDILAETIGLELEEPETECSLDDSFLKVDISAITKEGDKIVIENQLEQTNHKHLGQIMTYMINMDAKIAVWIAKKLREEHINVINWLNEFTDKDFYLIQLESYQIDNSKPAPFFKVICKPDKKMKAIGEKKKELSKAGTLRKDFWTKLLDNSREKTDFFSKTTPSTWTVIQHHINKNIYLVYRINKDKVGIGVLFTKHLKNHFLNLKKDWESEFGFDLEFNKAGNAGKPSEKYQFIKWFNKGGYKNPESEWNQIQEEMIDNMIKLEKLFKVALSKIKFSNKAA